MNKRDLIKRVSEYTEVDPRTTGKVVEGMWDVILATVASGEPVAITGIARFARVERAARMARNPATGEPVRVPAKKAAKITPLKTFKSVALGTTPAPKLGKATAAKKTAGTTTKTAAKSAAKAAPAATTKSTGRAAKSTATTAKAPASKATKATTSKATATTATTKATKATTKAPAKTASKATTKATKATSKR